MPRENDPNDLPRRRMVREQVEARGVRDPHVLAAMARVPRERFVPDDRTGEAYGDRALPLPHGQAISQPYVVAAMTEALALRRGAGEDAPRILEVGTGSGYQAAVLLAAGARVLTVERIPDLAATAARRLSECPGLDPDEPDRVGPPPGALTVLTGDGIAVAAEHGPFEGILVTAVADAVPRALLDALAPGASLVIPVARRPGLPEGMLHVFTREGADFTDRALFEVRFVPLLAGVAGAEGGIEATD